MTMKRNYITTEMYYHIIKLMERNAKKWRSLTSKELCKELGEYGHQVAPWQLRKMRKLLDWPRVHKPTKEEGTQLNLWRKLRAQDEVIKDLQKELDVRNQYLQEMGLNDSFRGFVEHGIDKAFNTFLGREHATRG